MATTHCVSTSAAYFSSLKQEHAVYERSCACDALAGGCCPQEWGLDVAKSSFLSGLPWAISFALANLAGFTADTLINKKLLSITATRKLMQGIASLGPATCLTFLSMQKSGPGTKILSSLLTLLFMSI